MLRSSFEQVRVKCPSVFLLKQLAAPVSLRKDQDALILRHTEIACIFTVAFRRRMHEYL